MEVLDYHGAQKRDELFAGVTGCGLADDLARFGVEGGIEREPNHVSGFGFEVGIAGNYLNPP